MTGISIIADEIALTLFERYGKRAMVHVEEQVNLSRKRSDWEGVKSWRYVGSEIERLVRAPLNLRPELRGKLRSVSHLP
jgi:hypothetical protein